MNKTNPKVDEYFVVGCGRCPLGGTPDCKTLTWTKEMQALRNILLASELTEEVKWSVPCYTFDGKNVLIMSAFKEYCALSFFKGALLKDPNGILEKPGENSQVVRLIRFTNVDQVVALEPAIKAYIAEAIEVEKAGLEVDFKEVSEFTIPEEFQEQLDADPTLRAAFEALTPGRQKGYLLYFSGAKQSKTRAARVEKYIPQILAGKGFHDR